MKNILLLSLLLVSITAFSQNPVTRPPGTPAYTFENNETTLKENKGLFKAKKGLINGIYADTTEANLGFIDAYAGAMIFTTSDNAIWMRNLTATAWVLQISSVNINTYISNFTDSSVYQIDSSTLLVCVGQGAERVCDTIHLGNSNTYVFITIGDTTAVVTCDTAQVICDVPDSCYQQQLCDTILLSHPLPVAVYQNGLRVLPNTPIREFGNDNNGGGAANLRHDTWLSTDYFKLTIHGKPPERAMLSLQNYQFGQLSASILEMNHVGAYQPTYNLLDENNPVNLYVNYTDPFAIPTQGALSGDTVGFMGNRYGYLLMTNSLGKQNRFEINDANAKQVGLFFDTYTQNTEAVTIFGNQLPSSYSFGNNPPTDSTLLDSRIAIFKTNKDIQFPGYPNSRDDGASPDGKGFYADASGNLKYGLIGGGSGSITADNGLTASTATNVQLGGPTTNQSELLHDSYINGNGFTLFMDDTTSTSPQILYVSGGTTTAIQASGVQGITSYGSSVGIGGTSPTLPMWAIGANSSASAVQEILLIDRNPFGSVSNGIGGSIDFQIATTVSSRIANQIISKWIDVTHATNTSQLDITGVNSAVTQTQMSLLGSGQLQLPQYTGTNFNTAQAKVAMVGTDGKVYAVDTTGLFGSGGGDGLLFARTDGSNATGADMFFDNNNKAMDWAGITTMTFEASTFNVVDLSFTSRLTINPSQTSIYSPSQTGTLNMGDALFQINQTGDIDITAFDPGGDASFASNSGDVGISAGKKLGLAALDSVTISGLTSLSATNNILVINSSQGSNRIGYIPASTFLTAITADNGLTASTATNVQLGGTLLHSTTINSNAFQLIVTGAVASASLDVTNTSNSVAVPAIKGTGSGTTGVGVVGVGNNNVGVMGTTTAGTGLYGIATSGVAVNASVTTGIAGNFQHTPATANTIVNAISIARFTSGTPATGIGTAIDLAVHTNGGGTAFSAVNLAAKWVDATHASRTGQFDLIVTNNASANTIMSAYGTGVVGIGISSSYTATRLNVVDNTVGAASIVDITSTSTAAAGNSQKVINVALSGANASSDQLTYGAYINNTHTGTNSQNYGIYSSATGGSGSNYGVVGNSTGSIGYGVYGFADGSGDNSIGTTGQNTGTGLGIAGITTSGTAITAFTQSGRPLNLDVSAGPTNSSHEMIKLSMTSNGAAAAGVGASINTYIDHSDWPVATFASEIRTSYTDPAVATKTSKIDFIAVNGAATQTQMSLLGSGQLQLPQYTGSNFNTAQAKVAMVGTDGKIYGVDTTGLFAGGAGGGYTTLAQFVGEPNWKMYNSDGTGAIQPITLGAAGSPLYSTGTAAAPDFFAGVTYATSGVNVQVNQLNTTDAALRIQLISSAAEDGFQVYNSAAALIMSIDESGYGHFPNGTTSAASVNMGQIGFFNLSDAGVGFISTIGFTSFWGNTGLLFKDGSAVLDFGQQGTFATVNRGRIAWPAEGTVKFSSLASTAASIIKGTGGEGQTSSVILEADEADDVTDPWEMQATTSGTLIFVNNSNTYLTLGASALTAAFDLSVPDEAYDATAWNGSLEVPTKNAVRDKIEALGGGHTIQEEGTPLTARAALNFIGAGITAADDAGNNATTVTIDADLNTIAGLTATTDNFLVSVSSAWASRTPSQVRTTLGLVVGTNVQAWDADLDYLAGFTPSANVKTILNAADYAAVKTALSLTIGTDVQAFDADLTTWAGITPGANVGTFIATPSSANLRSALTDESGTGAAIFNNTPSLIVTNTAVTAVGNAATVAVTASLTTVTNNSAATLTITLTTASAVDGQVSTVRVLDFSGVAQTITWVNTENSSVIAPTTSNGSTTLFLTVKFIYNSATSKWRCIGYAGFEWLSILIALLLGAILTKIETVIKRKYA